MKWITAINQYSTGAQTIQAESDWRIVLRSYLLVMATNSVVILALILLSSTYLLPVLKANIASQQLPAILTFAITLFATAPFFWGLAIRRLHSLAYRNLWLDKKYNHGPLVMLEVVRNLLLVVLVGIMVNHLFNTMIALVAILPVIVIVLLVFARRLNSFYARLEKRFLSNLNQREQMQSSASNDLSPWDAHMTFFTMPAESTVVGKSLQDLAWREKYGINIAYIERGSITITAPARSDVLYPFDKMAVIGTDVQLEQFRIVLESAILPSKNGEEEITLNKIIVDNHTALRGKTLRTSGIREITNGLVVGIERNGQRILNPDSTTVFEWDDIVWIVGDRKKIDELKNNVII
jgi:CPA2 family monovalent cation:H+ antiporter-2